MNRRKFLKAAISAPVVAAVPMAALPIANNSISPAIVQSMRRLTEFEEFERMLTLQIAMAMQISVQDLTQEFSDGKYSSARELFLARR